MNRNQLLASSVLVLLLAMLIPLESEAAVVQADNVIVVDGVSVISDSGEKYDYLGRVDDTNPKGLYDGIIYNAYDELYFKQSGGPITITSGVRFRNIADGLGFNDTVGSTITGIDLEIFATMDAPVVFENVNLGCGPITVNAGKLRIVNSTVYAQGGNIGTGSFWAGIVTATEAAESVIEIVNSTVYTETGIYTGPNSRLYLNNSHIIQVDVPSSLENNFYWHQVGTYDMTEGNDNSLIYIDHTNFTVDDNWDAEVRNVWADGVDEIYIYDCTFHGGVKTGVEVESSRIFRVDGCSFEQYWGTCIEVAYLQEDDNSVSNCYIGNPAGDEYVSTEDTQMGIGEFSEYEGENLPGSVIHIFNNTIEGFEVGVFLKSMNGIIYNNTISDIRYKDMIPPRLFGGIAIGFGYYDLTVPQNVLQAACYVHHNLIMDSSIGIAAMNNGEIHYNAFVNVDSKVVASPTPFRTYDGFKVDASMNYLETNYPTYLAATSIDLESYIDVMVGEMVADFLYFEEGITVVSEPFAVTKTIGSEWDIPIRTGWNLVYVPYNLDNNETVAEILDKSSSISAMAVRSLSGEYVFYIKDFQTESHDFVPTTPGGFYVYSNNNIDLTLNVVSMSGSYVYQQGWNVYGSIVSGYKLSSYVEMNEIESIAYRGTDGNYNIMIPHTPLRDSEIEELDNIPTYSGIYMYSSIERIIPLETAIYDKESGIFVTPEGIDQWS